MMRPLQLATRAFPGRPAFDTAVSRALLQLVAEGSAPETFRLYVPDDVLAFSVLDAAHPGFPAAARAAHALGWTPVLRLAGGRAAVFHRETLAFAWSLPVEDSRLGIHERFEALASLVAQALRRLGVDARIGEVPGEYCPGAHSVNARGRRKLMGVGQRVIRGAAHVGGVIVVRDAARVRDALAPVYQALGYDWDPDATGAVEDEVGAISTGDVAAALVAELRVRHQLVEVDPDAAWIERASELEPRHRVGLEGAIAGGS
jgi:lipoate-protein ligase A